MKKHPVLEVKGITKKFADVIANDHIHFNLNRGEIHALLGENGAGKSTLMNIISGLYQPDEGNIFIEGLLTGIRESSDAIEFGIHMVHQHFMLIPVFSVIENIILGCELTRGFALDMKKARKQIDDLTKNYGLAVDLDAITENLAVGMQQRVEIIKALFRQVKILILDEPTAVLTPQEVEDLFKVMHQLTQKGVSIIFITHKLREVMTFAHRITVMRHGQVIGTTTPAETDEKELASMMVGRDVLLNVKKTSSQQGKTIIKIDNLSVLDERNIRAVQNVSFKVHAGEIVGIAGVQGNGQRELAEALAGLRAFHEGTVYLNQEEISSPRPRVLMEKGLGHVPEDRLKHGLVLPYSIADNQVLCSYYKPPFARNLKRNAKAVAANSEKLIKQFDIRASGPSIPVDTLSGGNQQKVILSRELSRDIQFLLANHPTRGLDVGSIEYIHQKIIEMRDQGVAVLLISSELDEILSLSDYIAVMFKGQIIAFLPAKKVTKDALGGMMAGAAAPL